MLFATTLLSLKSILVSISIFVFESIELLLLCVVNHTFLGAPEFDVVVYSQLFVIARTNTLQHFKSKKKKFEANKSFSSFLTFRFFSPSNGERDTQTFNKRKIVFNRLFGLVDWGMKMIEEALEN